MNSNRTSCLADVVLKRANADFPYVALDEVHINSVAWGRKYVSFSEPYFAGHFPDEPIVPGVLIIAALTSLASLLTDARHVVSEIRRFRFVRPVRPGDILDLEARPVEVPSGKGGPWFEVLCTVDGNVAARGRIRFANED